MKKYSGEVRGVAILTDAEFVRKKWGVEGLNKIKAVASDLGYPIEYEKIKALAWYPLALRMLSLFIITDTFNMSGEQVEEMGYTAPKFSFLMKWLVKYFASTKMTIDQAPSVWRKHYTIGSLETQYNEGDNFALVQVKGLAFPEMGIKYLQGYFRRVTEFSVGKPVYCELTETPGEESKYYAFKAWWDK